MADATARFRIVGEDATGAAFRSMLGKADRAAKEMNGLFKAGFAGGVAGALVTGAMSAGRALVGMATNAIETGDALQKAAVKAGIGGEEISQLAYAARMSDVELGTLSNSLRFMQKNIAEAASGSKSAKAAFEDLGLPLQMIEGLAADKQFELIADRISQIQDPANRSRMATELFGKAGAELLPMFEQGAEGIRAAREEAERLGQSFTNDQLKRLADADDSIKRLKASYEGFATTLTAKASPALSRWMDEIAAMITQDPAMQLASDIKLLQAVLAQPGTKFTGRRFLPGMYENIDGGFYTAEELQTLLSQLQRRQRRTTARSAPGGQGRGRAEELQALGQQLAEEDARNRSASEAAAKSVAKFQADRERQQLEIWRALDAGNAAQESQLRQTETDTQRIVREANDFYSALIDQVAVGGIGGDEAMARWRAHLDEVLPEIKATSERTVEAWKSTTDQMTEYSRRAAENMQDAFADFLFDPFEGGLKGMLRSFANVLRRMVAEAAAAQIFGKPGSGGLGDIISAGANAVFSGFGFGGQGAVPGRAAGGPVTSGRTYLVGEEGPELFTPPTNGEIITAPKTRKLLQARQETRQVIPEAMARWGLMNSGPVAATASPSAMVAPAPVLAPAPVPAPVIEAGGLFGGLVSKLFASPQFAAARAAQAATPAIAGARAAGGPVEGGRTYLVGERGPELFRSSPSKAAAARPATQVNVAPVFNIDARGATTDLLKVLPSILEANTQKAVQMAKAAMYDDMSRGAFGRI